MNFLRQKFTVDKIELIDPMAASRNILYADKLIHIPISERDSFLDKVNIISEDLGINPDWLMLVMWKESVGINPAIQNTKYPVQNGYATGLIQFVPATAGTVLYGSSYNAKTDKANGYKIGIQATNQLKLMSGIKQLDYVKKYFLPYKGKLNSFHDLYLATFFPLGLGKPDNWVIEASNISKKSVYDLNPAIAKFASKEGEITIADFKKYTADAVEKAGINTKEATKYDLYMKFLNNKKFAIAVLAVIPIVIGGYLLYREGALDGIFGKVRLATA